MRCEVVFSDCLDDAAAPVGHAGNWAARREVGIGAMFVSCKPGDSSDYMWCLLVM